MKSPETGSIYIEGSDCTGKDVVGGIIANEHEITNIQKLALHGNNPYDADKTKELPTNHPLFPIYLVRSIIWDIQNWNPDKNKNHLQLSYTATRSAAWCQASGDKLADVFYELLEYSPLFNHSFLLCASVIVKQDRLRKRENEKGKSSFIDSLIFTKPDFVREMDEYLIKIAQQKMRAQIVNTDNHDIEEVGNILLDIINEVPILKKNKRVLQQDITPEIERFHQEIVSYAKAIATKYGLSEEKIEKVIQPFKESK